MSIYLTNLTNVYIFDGSLTNYDETNIIKSQYQHGRIQCRILN